MTTAKTASLLCELGTEEIPAGYLQEKQGSLPDQLAGLLASHGLTTGGTVTVWTAPRRIAFLASDILLRQADRSEQLVGPPAKVAFDANGEPTKAAVGFAKRNNVDVQTLQRGPVEGREGDYVLLQIDHKGKVRRRCVARGFAGVFHLDVMAQVDAMGLRRIRDGPSGSLARNHARRNGSANGMLWRSKRKSISGPPVSRSGANPSHPNDVPRPFA